MKLISILMYSCMVLALIFLLIGYFVNYELELYCVFCAMALILVALSLYSKDSEI